MDEYDLIAKKWRRISQNENSVVHHDDLKADEQIRNARYRITAAICRAVPPRDIIYLSKLFICSADLKVNVILKPLIDSVAIHKYGLNSAPVS